MVNLAQAIVFISYGLRLRVWQVFRGFIKLGGASLGRKYMDRMPKD
jgi:hypothetical protein